MKIVQYFHSPELPTVTRELCESWSRLNPDLEHIVYSYETGRDFLRRNYGKRCARAFESCVTPSMQSDMIRFHGIHHHGGLYADVKFECHRPVADMIAAFDPGRHGFVYLNPRRQRMSTKLFCIPEAGSPVLEVLGRLARRSVELRLVNHAGFVTGPRVLHVLQLFCGAIEPDGPQAKVPNAEYRAVWEKQLAILGRMGFGAQVAELVKRLVPVGKRELRPWASVPKRDQRKEYVTHWTLVQRRQSIFREPLAAE